MLSSRITEHTGTIRMLGRSSQEWEKLWTINKRLIDPVAPRHTAVAAAGRVPLTLTNGPEVEEVEIIALHKKNPAVGQKASVRSKVWPRVSSSADNLLVGTARRLTLHRLAVVIGQVIGEHTMLAPWPSSLRHAIGTDRNDGVWRGYNDTHCYGITRGRAMVLGIDMMCSIRRVSEAAAPSQLLWLDQADARAVAEGEEVTLMDWGNAVITVRLTQP